jgi:hypothetical protein
LEIHCGSSKMTASLPVTAGPSLCRQTSDHSLDLSLTFEQNVHKMRPALWHRVAETRYF